MLCFNQMKAYHVTKILKLGFGHGRDTTFFGSKGIEVEALDYSVIAVGTDQITLQIITRRN